MITMDDDDGNVMMECGHVISRSGMKGHLKDTLKDRKQSDIVCPHCKVKWDLELCLQVSGMSTRDQDKFATMSKQNYMRLNNTGRQCPRCSTFIENKNKKDRVKCRRCRSYICWPCDRKWQSNSTRVCGHNNCPKFGKMFRKINSDLQSQLRNSQRGDISGVPNCPNTRLCPMCKVKIVHEGGCLHMTCKSASCQKMQRKWLDEGNEGILNQFCFICLATAKRAATWANGRRVVPNGWHSIEMCGAKVAPIQQV